MKADVVIKRDTDIWGVTSQGVHTFLFGARCRVFLRFRDWLLAGDRYLKIGTDPIEWAFRQYIEESGDKVEFWKNVLGIRVRYADALTSISA